MHAFSFVIPVLLVSAKVIMFVFLNPLLVVYVKVMRVFATSAMVLKETTWVVNQLWEQSFRFFWRTWHRGHARIFLHWSQLKKAELCGAYRDRSKAIHLDDQKLSSVLCFIKRSSKKILLFSWGSSLRYCVIIIPGKKFAGDDGHEATLLPLAASKKNPQPNSQGMKTGLNSSLLVFYLVWCVRDSRLACQYTNKQMEWIQETLACDLHKPQVGFSIY